METQEPNQPQEEAHHLSGDRLGKYVILGELGRGSMGVVYEAFQEGVKRKVALKVLPANITLDEKHVERFHREAEAVGKLNHPNIIQIFDNGTIEENLGDDKTHRTHYFAMEMVDGTDFTAIRCKDRDGVERAARLIRDAARALSHAHAEGVIHRDIKPSNLLVDRKDRVLVTDFGLARIKDSASLTSTDAIVGTPKYMAPEQVLSGSQTIDGRADIYSLGATLYEAVTARPPLDAPSIQAYFKKILEDRPVSPRKENKHCPLDLATIILRCLEKSPKDRYPDADAFADDLDRFLKGERIVARPKSALERSLAWVQRHKVITGLAAAALVGLVLTLALSSKVQKTTSRVELLERITQLQNETDIEVAAVEARELLQQYPGDKDVTTLIAFLAERAADRELDAQPINWIKLVRELKRAGRSDDLWYLMGLVELDRSDEARATAEQLPPAAEVRRLTLARLAVENQDPKLAADLLAEVKGDRHPFTDFVAAQAHHRLGLSAATPSLRTKHLGLARKLLDTALARVRRRWLRMEIQFLRWNVRRALGENVSLQDSVDDLTGVANRWWKRVSATWGTLTEANVDDLRIYIRSVLSLAGLNEAFAAEIEGHANAWLKKPAPRDKTIGHLLMAVARLSEGDLDASSEALDKADEGIDDADLDLLPYVNWGKSLTDLGGGDLRGAVLNASQALEGGVSESRFKALENVARYTEFLAKEAGSDKQATQRLVAKNALKEQLTRLKPPPAWVISLLQRLAASPAGSSGARD